MGIVLGAKRSRSVTLAILGGLPDRKGRTGSAATGCGKTVSCRQFASRTFAWLVNHQIGRLVVEH